MLAKLEIVDQAQWFCVATNSREEMTARAWLIIRGFETADIYLPMMWRLEKHGRGGPTRLREAHRPMFPGYLFVRCLARADWFGRVRNSPGVARFLGGEAPEPMSPEAIDVIQFEEACRARPEDRKKLRWPFSIDDEVRIKSGPFVDFHAKISSDVDDRGRIMALVDLFKCKTPVQFYADDLEKL